jgi:hypothetical protein
MSAAAAAAAVFACHILVQLLQGLKTLFLGLHLNFPRRRVHLIQER